MASYNPNFAPWQSFSSGGPLGNIPTGQRLTPTLDQDLLNESYQANESIKAIAHAARLKHLKDWNAALARFGQNRGDTGAAAVARAEAADALGERYPGLPTPGGFGAPGFGTGSPGGGFGSGSAELNRLTKLIAEDSNAAMRQSLFTPLEPYLNTEQRAAQADRFAYNRAKANAQGQLAGGAKVAQVQQPQQQQRQPSLGDGSSTVVNPQGVNYTGLPLTGAQLTDQRVRQQNDTKDAERLINAGGITTQQQLENLFPNSDIKRLSGLLYANQKASQDQYDLVRQAADTANQYPEDLRQAQAEEQYQAGLKGLHFWQGDSAKAALEQKKLDFLAQPFPAPSPEAIAAVEKRGQGAIQFDPESHLFKPVLKQPGPVEPIVPNRVYRQDLPDQNFQTSLTRSPFYSGLPIVYSVDDWKTLPPGANFVTGDGRTGRVPGGHQTASGQPIGPSYYTGAPSYVPQAAAPLDPNARVNFGPGSPGLPQPGGGGGAPDQGVQEAAPVSGLGNVFAPQKLQVGPDGIPIIQDPSELQYLDPSQEVFRYNGTVYRRKGARAPLQQYGPPAPLPQYGPPVPVRTSMPLGGGYPGLPQYAPQPQYGPPMPPLEQYGPPYTRTSVPLGGR